MYPVSELLFIVFLTLFSVANVGAAVLGANLAGSHSFIILLRAVFHFQVGRK
jgi:hypothetical protein